MKKNMLFLLVVLSTVLASPTISAEEKSPVFPLGRSWVKGRDLPLPLGIGVTFYHQEQDYDLVSLDMGSFPIGSPNPSDVAITNSTNEINAKFDLWLLPFLDVFGIIGRVNGETTVTVGPPLGEIVVDYDGLVYGGGFTLATGVKHFFGSLTTHFMRTDLKGDRSLVQVWLITPKAGIYGKRGAIWGGAMFQHADEEHRGGIMIPYFGELEYIVTLKEKSPWNYLVGGRYDLTTHWNFEAEGGFGKRKHALISLTYRR